MIGSFALSFSFASGLVALLMALQVSTWQANLHKMLLNSGCLSFIAKYRWYLLVAY